MMMRCGPLLVVFAEAAVVDVDPETPAATTSANSSAPASERLPRIRVPRPAAGAALRIGIPRANLNGLNPRLHIQPGDKPADLVGDRAGGAAVAPLKNLCLFGLGTHLGGVFAEEPTLAHQLVEPAVEPLDVIKVVLVETLHHGSG